MVQNTRDEVALPFFSGDICMADPRCSAVNSSCLRVFVAGAVFCPFVTADNRSCVAIQTVVLRGCEDRTELRTVWRCQCCPLTVARWPATTWNRRRRRAGG